MTQGNPTAGGDSLSPGTRVGRYEILREISRGGMGIVYRARDCKLSRDVALKCIRSSLLEDPAVLRRFQREAEVSARLAHPNIVSIFDVFETDGVSWIAMQLVEGPTLRDVLEPGRPLATSIILRYARQLAEALGAAHARGILHRDIKPENVILATDDRVLLTDFGLACAFAPPDSGDSLPTLAASGGTTQPGALLGTPAYMSPEQALGKQLDPRSDLFSLGSLVYELCTGQAAFRQQADRSLWEALLRHEPAPMQRFNPDVPEELERVVRKCLAKKKDERYQSASDLLADLIALERRLQYEESAERFGHGPGVTRAGRRWWQAGLGLATLLAVAALLIWIPAARQNRTPQSVLAASRPQVAVVPLVDRTGLLDGPLRAQMLTSVTAARISEGQELRAVAPERVQEALAGGGNLNEDPLAGIHLLGESLSPDWILTGKLYREGEIYLATLDLFSPQGEDPVSSFQVSAGRVATLADMISARLRETLGLERISSGTATFSPAGAASDEALMLETSGRLALAQLRYLEAIDALERAAASEMPPPSVHAWLAKALHQAGFGRRAREVAGRALNMVDALHLPPSSRDALFIRAVCAAVQNETDEEVDALRLLVERYPDEPDLRLDLAAALRRAGHPDSALAQVDGALALDPSSPRAYLLRGYVLAALRSVEKAHAAYDRAEKLYAGMGTLSGTASVELLRGHLEFHRGDYIRAAAHYQRSLQVFQEAGQPLNALEARKASADMDLKQGQIARARLVYDEVLPEARQAGHYRLVITTLTSFGPALYHVGKEREAGQALRDAISLAREIGNDRLRLPAQINLAWIVIHGGGLAEGRALAEDAVTLARSLSDRRREILALELLGDAEYKAGRVADAAARLREILRLQSEASGHEHGAAQTSLMLASCASLLGRPTEALELTERAVALDRDQERENHLGYALAARALRRGELARWQEAESDLSEAQRIAQVDPKARDLAVYIRMARTRVALLRDDAAAARTALRELQETGAGLEGDQRIELRLLDCQVAARTGQTDTAASLCRDLVQDPVPDPVQRLMARLALAQSLVAVDPDAAEQHAAVALEESRRLELPVQVAQAAALLLGLPAEQRRHSTREMAAVAREALGHLLGATAEADRAALRSRGDLEPLFALFPESG